MSRHHNIEVSRDFVGLVPIGIVEVEIMAFVVSVPISIPIPIPVPMFHCRGFQMTVCRSSPVSFVYSDVN